MKIYRDRVSKISHNKTKELNKTLVRFQAAVETVVFQVKFFMIF